MYPAPMVTFDTTAEIDELRRQLAERDRELRECREREQATTDILRAIAGSPADVQAVLGDIVQHAAHLTQGASSVLYLVRGNVLRLTSVLDPNLSQTAITGDEAMVLNAQRGFDASELLELPLSREVLQARIVLQRELLHIPDMAAWKASTGPDRAARDFLLSRGIYSSLAVPLLHADAAIGVLSVLRHQATAFTDHQIRLLQTFADQAAIAIENARLFQEVQEWNSALTERQQQLQKALAQQIATGEILRVIASSPTDLQPVLETITSASLRLLDVGNAAIFRVDGQELVVAASHARDQVVKDRARNRQFLSTLRYPLSRGMLPGRAVIEGRTVCVDDLRAADAEYPDNVSAAHRWGFRSGACAPLRRDEVILGVLSIQRLTVQPFTEQEVALLETFADQAAIAIDNARLFQELQESNATLREALEQQTATAEILRVIASSPSDLQRVMDTIAAVAARLCDASDVIISRTEGDYSVPVAAIGSFAAEVMAGVGRIHLNRGSVTGRTILDRRPINLADLAAESVDEYPEGRAFQARFGYRSVLSAPLLRQDRAIGMIVILRKEVRPFTDEQLALLETFANQAAIGIENACLFSELQERDDRRRLELERASAIQQRLLPEKVEGWPGMLENAVRFRPAVETSGDFYDVLALTPTRLGDLPPLQIAVGDVAGKGMAAALVTALARTALRATAAVPTALATPANTLRLAGQRLHDDVGAAHFVACALALVEPPGVHHTGPRLRLANAAQVPALLVRGGRAEEIEPPGYRLPLGVQNDGDYEDVTAKLAPGDVVVFSSDGLVEAPARDGVTAPEHLLPAENIGELFGFERLQQSAAYWSGQAEDAEGVAEGVWSDLTTWCGEESHHDDMTLLVLRVQGGTHNA